MPGICDESAWLAALDAEWDECERWTVDQAGPVPSSSGVALQSPPPADPAAVRAMLDGSIEQRRDNTAGAVKVELRRRALTWVDAPSVLELCCGMGHMWAWVYRGLPYHGVDEARVFSPRLCDMARAEEWVEEHDLATYNFLDVDTYGSPWAMISRFLHRVPARRVAVVCTCGLRLQWQRGGSSDHLARVFGVRPGARIAAGGALFDHYREIVMSFMTETAARTGRHVSEALRGDNGKDGAQTNYWAFRLEDANG